MNRHTFEHHRRLRRCAGIGLVTAIFLLVVLAGLAVALVGISGGQQSASALDVQGARAHLAARAGIEWALYQRLQNPAAFPCDQATPTSFALPATSTLNGFFVSITCVSFDLPLGAPTGSGSEVGQRRMTIQSTSCNRPPVNSQCSPSNNPDYVEREIQVII